MKLYSQINFVKKLKFFLANVIFVKSINFEMYFDFRYFNCLFNVFYWMKIVKLNGWIKNIFVIHEILLIFFSPVLLLVKANSHKLKSNTLVAQHFNERKQFFITDKIRLLSLLTTTHINNRVILLSLLMYSTGIYLFIIMILIWFI